MKLNQLLLVGLLVTAGSAFAQDAGGAGAASDPGMTDGAMGGSMDSTTESTGTWGAGSQAFTDLDANQDGNLTRDEIESDVELSGQFDDLDADQDGQLSAEEFTEYEQQTQEDVIQY